MTTDERVELLVQLTHRGEAHVLIGDAETPVRLPAEDIARDAELPASELPGRRFTATRDGDRLTGFRLVNDPRM
ncbi:hypothetical protein OHR68_43285 [Spirillospora sp. NBC_00431]